MSVGRKQGRQDLSSIRTNPQEVCAELVREHYKRIYSFLAYLSGDPARAEDLTQETFAAAWANMGRFKGGAPYGLWLRKIAYGKFIDSIRRARRRTALGTELQQQAVPAPAGAGPLGRMLADERSRCVFDAMCRLAPPARLVVVLHYLEGLSYREIAKVLAEPVGTVKWRTGTALKEMKASLNGRV